jgi:hypothetical protein
MKKQIFILLSFVCLTVFNVSKIQARPPKDKGVILSMAQKEEEKLMVSRLYEIHQMDKSNLSANERKILRKEVKSIKSKMSEMKGGVYLSVGAVIIIILLLILIL